MRSSSIHDVARRAGVSVGTVSNVLNHPELVAAATRGRVESAMSELGYVLNGSARNLRTGRSNIIGLVVLDVRNPFFTEVARGAEDAANEHGYAVMLCNSDDSEDKEAHYLRELEQQRAMGALITPVSTSPELLDAMVARGLRAVLLDHPSPTGERCSVAVDDVRGGELAAAHLLEQGHETLAVINGPRSIQQCEDRREGVRRAVAIAGGDPDTDVVELEIESLNAPGGEAAATQLVEHRPSPTGVVCVNDLVALGALRGLRSHGYDVPGDVSIIGYDDVEFASALRVPLTTVRQPKYRLGRAAAELLLEETGDPDHTHQQVLFYPELIVRESSAPATART
ncbi:LacI family transcriptional regulator [Egibacter rhizosphaerae]|uniref:LacI family transcriptional regulator n=1 Tax=Egibacter rhizosphaerae TaxID=1670831 RepID=A0A411YG50_9ACTN|nr:LacI family DNA-binding transcriptional regulator [Egibacter rhizosphaerae]QBI20198.1 LacI family transcriptional regulator [Egibacter rhizosphaerae]